MKYEVIKMLGTAQGQIGGRRTVECSATFSKQVVLGSCEKKTVNVGGGVGPDELQVLMLCTDAAHLAPDSMDLQVKFSSGMTGPLVAGDPWLIENDGSNELVENGLDWIELVNGSDKPVNVSIEVGWEPVAGE